MVQNGKSHKDTPQATIFLLHNPKLQTPGSANLLHKPRPNLLNLNYKVGT